MLLWNVIQHTKMLTANKMFYLPAQWWQFDLSLALYFIYNINVQFKTRLNNIGFQVEGYCHFPFLKVSCPEVKPHFSN